MFNPYTWLVGKVGSKVATGVMIGLAVFMVWGLAILALHARHRAEEKQVQQSNASAAAVASAAKNAVETVSGRMTADQEIDAATALALKEIEDAKDADALRAAVIASVCLRDSHRNDPACKLHSASTR